MQYSSASDTELQRISGKNILSLRTDVPPLLSVPDNTDLMSANSDQESLKDTHQHQQAPTSPQRLGSVMCESELTTEVPFTKVVNSAAMTNNSTFTEYKKTSTTLSGPVQVIDVTSCGKNTDIANRLFTDSLQVSKDSITNCTEDEFSPVVAGNTSSTTPLKG